MCNNEGLIEITKRFLDAVPDFSAKLELLDEIIHMVEKLLHDVEQEFGDPRYELKMLRVDMHLRKLAFDRGVSLDKPQPQAKKLTKKKIHNETNE